MSVASLITPKMDCRVGPAPAMLDEETNPPKFKDFVCSDFTEAYEAAAGNREAVLHFFRIHHTQKSRLRQSTCTDFMTSETPFVCSSLLLPTMMVNQHAC
jgi:hypothetical protein